ncbi:hypothetical protein RA280_27680 [Cupriavidus sp. CV2]|uniref:hypothetical protein n=1 Tax=Cupriavidus ulmosensis TaxID=3065913 RepID=UPI00296B32DE|nr:hypothetical protein [Cupriavidus sp. CV2]MDW3685454.1 hypothetical protein [Cupriavidus sp. CV2]
MSFTSRAATRSRLVLSALATFCLPALAFAQAAPYPAKPISLVVGSAPGGSVDLFARAIGKHLQDASSRRK